MQATAQPTTGNALENGIDPVYFTREDLAQAFPPANPYEVRLLTQAALALERLLRAYDLERQILEKENLADLFTQKPEQFKNLARYIADCDRIYRRCVEALERAQRARAKSARVALPPPEIRVYPPAQPHRPDRMHAIAKRHPPSIRGERPRPGPQMEDNSKQTSLGPFDPCVRQIIS